MGVRSESRAVLAGLGAVGLLSLAAVAAGTESPASTVESGTGGSIVANAAVALVTIVAIVGFVILVSVRFTGGSDEPWVTRPLWQKLLSVAPIVVIPLAAAWLVAAFADDAAERDPLLPPEEATEELARRQERTQGQSQAAWWTPLAAGGVTIVALGIAGAALAIRHRRAAEHGGGEDAATATDGALDAVDESLEVLLAEPDHRRAVEAAYARMERVLARVGLPRDRTEAPGEYLDRVLVPLGATAATARTLTRLFERAKFSTHPVGPDARDEAIASLRTLRTELA